MRQRLKYLRLVCDINTLKSQNIRCELLRKQIDLPLGVNEGNENGLLGTNENLIRDVLEKRATHGRAE
jgi:dihydroxyacetone kinase DhaKLM complex PTS-EIIA-like component DhaM